MSYTLSKTGAQVDASLAAADAALPAAGGNITADLGIGGNLTLSGTGARIRGDFSNATVANRAMFQSSTTNGGTFVETTPNGTSAFGGFGCFNGTDPANASKSSLQVSGSIASIQSTATGTGKYLPLRFNVDGGFGIHITASGTSTAGNNPLVLIGATTTADTVSKLQVTGAATVSTNLTVGQYRLSNLNTAPASATDTGTKGEIRVTADAIYVCTATNTWVKAALATW